MSYFSAFAIEFIFKVSSASTLPNFAVRMRDSDSICQPVPMHMTPSSLAERNRDPVSSIFYYFIGVNW